MNYDELGDVLFNLLDIPVINRIKNKARSNEKTTERLSFRDVMRFVFVPQEELGTTSFLKNNDPFTSYKNSSTFELIHKLLSPDANNINEEIVDKNNLIEKTNKQIAGFNQYLEVRDAEDIVKLKEEIELLNLKIDKRKVEKQEHLSSYKSAHGKQSTMYQNLKKEALEATNGKRKIIGLKRDLNISLANKKELMNHYQEELQQLSATVEVMHLIKIENHIKTCPLCNSVIEKEHKNMFDYNLTEQLRKQLDEKIKILDKTITRMSENLNEMEDELKSYEDREKIISIALEEYTQKISIPNLSEIEAINRIILDLENKLNFFKELIGVHNNIKQLLKDKGVYEKKLKDLQDSLNNLLEEGEDKEEILTFLNKKYIDMLNKFKYTASFGKDYIDEHSFMPWYNNADVFSHDSGGLLTSIQISYLGAILLWKKQYPERQNHPSFLLLDSLSKYTGTNNEGENADTLDPESYKEIYKFLIDISKDVQIIIVDNTPPPFVQKYNKYKFYRTQMRGLINPKYNEK
ncbi:hypothetical protein [Exiguobacterium acetylicum]|uniref:hypothetical protein n=1 Tax=Exiguobacterium acetylicum TaxID=41170 RepID=UPI0034D41761